MDIGNGIFFVFKILLVVRKNIILVMVFMYIIYVIIEDWDVL